MTSDKHSATQKYTPFILFYIKYISFHFPYLLTYVNACLRRSLIVHMPHESQATFRNNMFFPTKIVFSSCAFNERVFQLHSQTHISHIKHICTHTRAHKFISQRHQFVHCLGRRLWPTQVNCLWRQTQLYASFEGCQLSAAAVIRYVIRINSAQTPVFTHIHTYKYLSVHWRLQWGHSCGNVSVYLCLCGWIAGKCLNAFTR